MKVRSVRSRLSALLLSGSLIAGSLTPLFSFSAKAEALPEIMGSTVNIADIIMSYTASAGYMITNESWINDLYNYFGSSFGYIETFVQNGLLELNEAGQYVSNGLDSAIEASAGYQALGLDTLFNVSSVEAEAGLGIAASGAGTIAGAVGGVASTGVLPLLFGVTGAYWGGIGLGTLAAHALGLYGKNIEYGIPIDELNNIIDSLPVGGVAVYADSEYRTGSKEQKYVIGMGIGFGYWNDSHTQINVGIFNLTGKSQRYTRYLNYGSGFNPIVDQATSNNNASAVVSASNTSGYTIAEWSAPNVFQTYNAFREASTKWADGTLIPNRPDSPDIITPEGNAKTTYSQSGSILPPNFTPQVNPNTGSVNPAGNSLSDWLNFAAQAKSNTVGGNIGDNGDVYEDAKNRIITPNPTPNPNPGTNPNPNPNPNPEPVPNPDYDVEQPNQPEYDPKDPQSPEDITTGSPWTTPNLLDKFPFCIPGDIVKVFKKLDSGDRIAPHITWRFNPPNTPVDYTFDVDFADFNTVASILRMLELMAFVVALAVATRSLIGAGG